MSGPRTVYVPLRVLDAEDALRIAEAINAALSALWDVYGEQMGERLLEAGRDDAPDLDDVPELPF